MSDDFEPTKLECPACGADLREGYTTCPACGAPVSSIDPEAIRKEKTVQALTAANQSLVQAGTGAAESAFGLGCSLGAILGLVLLIVVFFLGNRNWIVLGIAAIGISLVAAGAAAWISLRAKTATIKTTYYRQVENEIEKFMKSNHYTQQEFEALANEVLDQNAPLRRYLSIHLKTNADRLEN